MRDLLGMLDGIGQDDLAAEARADQVIRRPLDEFVEKPAQAIGEVVDRHLAPGVDPTVERLAVVDEDLGHLDVEMARQMRPVGEPALRLLGESIDQDQRHPPLVIGAASEGGRTIFGRWEAWGPSLPGVDPLAASGWWESCRPRGDGQQILSHLAPGCYHVRAALQRAQPNFIGVSTDRYRSYLIRRGLRVSMNARCSLTTGWPAHNDVPSRRLATRRNGLRLHGLESGGLPLFRSLKPRRCAAESVF